MTEYSKEKLEQILNRRPDWSAFVSTMLDDEGAEYFVITLASPGENQACSEVVSEDVELSVYGGDWHTHIELFQPDDEVECLLDLLESIFSEKVVSVCEYRNDAEGNRVWAGSDLVQIDEQSQPEDGFERVILSWLGTHSRVVDLRHK